MCAGLLLQWSFLCSYSPLGLTCQHSYVLNSKDLNTLSEAPGYWKAVLWGMPQWQGREAESVYLCAGRAHALWCARACPGRPKHSIVRHTPAFIMPGDTWVLLWTGGGKWHALLTTALWATGSCLPKCPSGEELPVIKFFLIKHESVCWADLHAPHKCRKWTSTTKRYFCLKLDTKWKGREKKWVYM